MVSTGLNHYVPWTPLQWVHCSISWRALALGIFTAQESGSTQIYASMKGSLGVYYVSCGRFPVPRMSGWIQLLVLSGALVTQGGPTWGQPGFSRSQSPPSFTPSEWLVSAFISSFLYFFSVSLCSHQATLNFGIRPSTLGIHRYKIQANFSHPCYSPSLLLEFFYSFSPPTPSVSPHLLLGLWRRKERWKTRGVGSAKLGSALAICCCMNLLLFPHWWAGAWSSEGCTVPLSPC